MPSSRLSRLWQYGGLATSMAFGAVNERLRRAAGRSDVASGPLMLSAGNMERLVAKLSKMRGAALKLGQMMSFQGMTLFIHLIHIIDLLLFQTQRCSPQPSPKFSNVFKTVPTTCPHPNGIKF